MDRDASAEAARDTPPDRARDGTTRDKASERWLCFDLVRAGIPFRDASNRVADDHSLPAAFVSLLIRRGASPKVVQTLARHSDARLTLGAHSELRPDEELRALGGVTSIGPNAGDPGPSPEAVELRRTGTEGGSVLASRLAQSPALTCRDLPSTAAGSAPHGAAGPVPSRQG